MLAVTIIATADAVLSAAAAVLAVRHAKRSADTAISTNRASDTYS